MKSYGRGEGKKLKKYLTLLAIPLAILLFFFSLQVSQSRQPEETEPPKQSVSQKEDSVLLPPKNEGSDPEPDPLPGMDKTQPKETPQATEGVAVAPAVPDDPSPVPDSTLVPPPTPRSSKSMDRVLTKAGTYGGDEMQTYGNVVVKSGDVTLKNTTIQETLIIDKTISSSTVRLENVTVNGSLLIYGSGNTVEMYDTVIQTCSVDAGKGVSTLNLSGRVLVAALELKSDTQIEGTDMTSAAQGEETIQRAVVPKLELYRVFVTLDGIQVGDFVTENVATLTIGDNVSVDRVDAGAKLDLVGNGQVSLLEARASGVVYACSPQEIRVAEGVEEPQAAGGSTDDSRYRRLPVPEGLSVVYEQETDWFAASWRPVEDAEGYGISVYRNGELYKTIDVPDGTLAGTKLCKGAESDGEVMEVRFEIYAKGDGAGLLNSYVAVSEEIALEISFAGGSGTQEDPYQVANARQLANVFASSGPGIYFRMVCDIDLNGIRMRPIGDEDIAFFGEFDGGGYTIWNYAPQLSRRYVGLFGVIGEGARVRRLTVTTSVVLADSQGGFDAFGTVAGVNRGIIEDCRGDVRLTASVPRLAAGGITGMNEGRVVSSSFAGILSSGKAESVSLGGIAGINRGTVRTCRNTGTVESASLDTALGGICGTGANGSGVQGSYNTGLIRAGKDSGEFSSAGGVVGIQHEGAAIQNSYSLAGQCPGTNDLSVELPYEVMVSEEFLSLIDPAGDLGWRFLPDSSDVFPQLDS